MLLQGKNNKGYALLVIVLLLTGAAVWFFTRKPAAAPAAPVSSPEAATPPTDSIPAPRTAQWLADSTHVYLLGDTKLVPAAGYPQRREITLDGDAFFDTPVAAVPLIIHTKLLTLTVKGKAALRVTGPAKEEWGEVDVIEGTVIVHKAYESTFNSPDTLTGGQMQMINRSIDLMEKEVFDAAALKAWRKRQPVTL
jgi:ferric-dicitrate binding protein FerR (iron transport regulator)